MISLSVASFGDVGEQQGFSVPASRRVGLQTAFLAVTACSPVNAIGDLSLNLKGRTACVTGGSRGIGRGIAVGLGEAGATVFITGRSQEGIAKTAEYVNAAGGRGIPIQCDHAVDSSVKQLFEDIGAQTGGTLDILVNNAFQDPSLRDAKTDALLSRGAKFFELPLDVWDDVHRVGLRSAYTASYFAAPLMIKSSSTGQRPFLCVTSAPAAVTYYFATAYGVSKAAEDRLIRDLNVELAPLGIDCVSFWPGVVYTETVKRLYETGDVARLERVTGGLDPNDVCESPLLTGRVIARFAADPSVRKVPYISPEGLAGRICVVAEGAKAFNLRDGGFPGTTAAALYGPDRRPAPSLRSLGYLGPVILKTSLPESLKWLGAKDGPFATLGRDVVVPFELMAKDPRTEDPRKEDLDIWLKRAQS